VAKGQQIASQAIAECWQYGAAVRYKSRQGCLMTEQCEHPFEMQVTMMLTGFKFCGQCKATLRESYDDE
jgi:hypothetical protein